MTETRALDEAEFKRRTKNLALAAMRIAELLPESRASDVLARQLMRSASSVGANYRAACRAKSTLDMISKLKIVEEEADETVYWLELILEGHQLGPEDVSDVAREATEILAMTVASIKTLRARSEKSQTVNLKS